MPLVTCPHCNASVFAIAAGGSLGIMGAADLQRCKRVDSHSRTRSGVDLLLACGEMRKAMEAEVGPTADYPVDPPWAQDIQGHRLYERWEQLEGIVLVEEQRYPCVIIDISPGGAAIWTESPPDLPAGTELRFELAGLHQLPAQLIRINGRVLGLMFLISPGQRQELTEWLLRRREALRRIE